ncbi:hypothetical protein NBH00_08485 [Paraconexibacter antarcticus]|uniref:Uncharacterized protein n=1 Tax=Paraconexibacter antarcticus TaxID=2949664 RepID=A0ABY5DW49_9ACTN|nr:hypothetical protein [Paraconexibacter antarcticus]UTI66230.1 hypothetical protein NBH00_08485 [Paraconexibacter antarcticus]
MFEEPGPEAVEIASGLRVRGLVVISDAEVTTLHRAVGEELLVSPAQRRWFAGEDLTPPSVGVVPEAQLRMLFDEPPDACELLETVIDRMAEAFPADIQPLDTT